LLPDVARLACNRRIAQNLDDSHTPYFVSMNRPTPLPGLVFVALFVLAGCDRTRVSEGENLARQYCAACHAFPEPHLLDKNTWEAGVLPQMASRLGAAKERSFNEALRNPHMIVLTTAVTKEEWEAIVRYYLAAAPDTLPYQSLPAEPELDPVFLGTGPFVPRMQSSGIITLLKADPTHERIFVGEAGTNWLRVFDRDRRLISQLTLGSPPTDVIAGEERVLLLESGILSPNDQPTGRLVEYEFGTGDSLHFRRVLIDSLIRPVFVEQVDFDRDGRKGFLICEYGDNRGRLALHTHDGATYVRTVLDSSAGAIRFEVRDLTGDGHPDIVALFAQGDERIVLFTNDGTGRFPGPQRILARFPPVYGSMYFSMHDFNGDGSLDILYVNGDNFDYSRVLKPYHGVRILENDGNNAFRERYFFPVYGAARAEVADFDGDGDLDVMTTSNFADMQRHPERGILFFRNTGPYAFQPYAFSIAAGNQWNLMTAADLNGDGRQDVIIGAMDLENIATLQGRSIGPGSAAGKDPMLSFENRMFPRSTDRTR
jgi:hypothetical protein